MPDSPAHFMYLFVFFDLPVTTAKKRRDYTRFRNFLLKDGFDMLQFSVYCRLIPGPHAAETHLKRVKRNLPPEGSVRTMLVTDQQYGRMQVMLGPKTEHETHVPPQQLILL